MFRHSLAAYIKADVTGRNTLCFISRSTKNVTQVFQNGGFCEQIPAVFDPRGRICGQVLSGGAISGWGV